MTAFIRKLLFLAAILAPLTTFAQAPSKKDLLIEAKTQLKEKEAAEKKTAAALKAIPGDSAHAAALATAKIKENAAHDALVTAQANFQTAKAAFAQARKDDASPNTKVDCDVSDTDNLCEYINFIGGSLFSANGNNYSQANLFLAFNFDRTVKIPRNLYLPSAGWNTFFQARLTAIPVNSSQTTQTIPAPGATATAPDTSTSSFLAAQKAIEFNAGTYLPVTFHHTSDWTMYWAPITRFGFSTPAAAPTGSSSNSTTGGTTVVTTTNLGSNVANNGQLYNFWSTGLRLASATVNSANALKTQHYLDIVVGKYSNLQSLVCAPPKAPSTASTCSPSTLSSDTRTTLLRLAFEGYIEVPTGNADTTVLLGISANTGPGVFSRNPNLDTNNRAPEDIEFFIGAKFDASKLIPKVFGN